MNDRSRRDSRTPNQLQGQTSPYLLQHLYNPVDWNPWGAVALERAQREDKPIFLSIGYAACHWCHVMERESFEDEEIADYLNRHFVPIKVDREERPDIDEIYMNAVQLMTGSGGWPLNVFLTPQLQPFVGGTYFPPRAGHGRIGFPDLLRKIHEVWSTRRAEVDSSAGKLTEQLRRIAEGEVDPDAQGVVGGEELRRACAELAQGFDPHWGGFGAAPKFPPDGGIALLLRRHQRDEDAAALGRARKTLDGMALGGMYDQVGGGFARYSVDERWLVPHFEKMLYNQALLVPLYVDAWRIGGDPLYRRIVEETLDFVRREMTGEGGGFYSSLDADSEGEEGKFYVWTASEIDAELGAEDGRRFREIYGITAEGNFEGSNIPNLLAGSLARRAADRSFDEAELVARLAPLREKLLAARERRVRPGTDDKILTAWNGLMISAYARAHGALGRQADLESGRRAAGFVSDRLMRDDRLLVAHRDGRSQLNGYLDDYAFFARGLLDLYEAGFDPRHLALADRLAGTLVERFEDRQRGGFFFVSDDHEELLTRNRSGHDGALPAGAGVAAELLLRLAVHLDSPAYREAALRAIDAARSSLRRVPSAHASLLLAADFAAGPVLEVALAGDPEDPATRALLEAVRRRHLPRLAIALCHPGDERPQRGLLAGKSAINGRPTAYVCRDYACREPAQSPADLERRLDEVSGEDTVQA